MRSAPALSPHLGGLGEASRGATRERNNMTAIEFCEQARRARMIVYEARPKNRLTGRHVKALQTTGFAWCGNAWLRAGPGSRPWGCLVRRYFRPRPKDPMVPVLGILLGTHNEFGRGLQRGDPRERENLP